MIALRRWPLAPRVVALLVPLALSPACAPEEPGNTDAHELLVGDSGASHADPSGVVWRGELFVSHRGPDGRIVVLRRQNGAWSQRTLPEYTVAGAALVVWGNDLYLAWVGTDKEGRLNVMRTSDGVTWRDKWVVGKDHMLTPALVVYGDRLNAFVPTYHWDNPDRGFQQYVFGTGGYQAQAEISPASGASPSAAVLGNDLYLTWQGNDKTLRMRKFIPGVGWQTAFRLPFGVEGTLLSTGGSLILAARTTCDTVFFYRSGNGADFSPAGTGIAITGGRPVATSLIGQRLEFVASTSRADGHRINVSAVDLPAGGASPPSICLGPVTPSEQASSPLGECLDRNTTDQDGDGLSDSAEACVAEKHVPEFLFHKDERHFPASVDWILPRSSLRFVHDRIIETLATGLTQQSLVTFSHPTDHTRPSDVSITSPLARGFQLDIPDRNQHGSSNRGDWRVYAHVYPNTLGGVTVQYYLSYPWSEGIAWDNHQGDWETVQVRRLRGGRIHNLTTYAHGEPTTWEPNYPAWNGTHPRIWIAKGTHAHFINDAGCRIREQHVGGLVGGGCDPDRPIVWQPWQGGNGGAVFNVGERGAPLRGQLWVNANVMWGGSAPPSFWSQWDEGRAR